MKNEMIDLNAWWKEDKWPIRNGIAFRDGTYFPVFVEGWASTSQGSVAITREEPRILDEVGEEYTIIGGHPVVRVGSGYARCGEGAWGSEGYVALTDERDDLIWIAYFDHSNPFVAVRVDGGVITATSNHDWEWSFPREEPQQFWIKLPSDAQ